MFFLSNKGNQFGLVRSVTLRLLMIYHPFYNTRVMHAVPWVLTPYSFTYVQPFCTCHVPGPVLGDKDISVKQKTVTALK